MSKHYYENGKPVNVYRNQVKIAGYHTETESGESVSFSDTYNDSAEVELMGNTVQESDYYAKDGLSSQITTVQGKNLFDFEMWYSSIVGTNISKSRGDDGSIKLVGSSMKYSLWICNRAIQLLPNTQYTLSIDYVKLYQYNVDYFSLGKTNSQDDITFGQIDSAITRSRVSKTFTTDITGKFYLNGYVNYNNNAIANEVTIYSIQLELGTYPTAYAPFVPDSPSPDYSLDITSNLAAGTYKTTYPNGDIYEFTLTEELRGINGLADKIVHDRKSHRGIIERRNASYTLTGGETFYSGGTAGTNTVIFQLYKACGGLITSINCLCNKFRADSLALYSSDIEGACSEGSYGQLRIRILRSRLSTADIAGFKQWLALNPISVVYQLANTVRTPITFTKVSSSSAPECPMTFLTNTPSLNYPADVVDAQGNLLSNNAAVGAFPSVRKYGGVADSYIPKTGKKIKRISDWVNPYDVSNFSNITVSAPIGFKRVYSTTQYNGVVGNVFGFKNTSEPLVNKDTWATLSAKDQIAYYFYTGNRIAISVDNNDSGWSDALSPITSEIAAYFYGWKMCNADGTVPYYKSEVPYTPSTWSGWGNIGSNVIKDLSGVLITSSGAGSVGIVMPTAIKPTKKYGFLYEVVSSSLTTTLFYLASSSSIFPSTFGDKSVGKKKAIVTSLSSGYNACYLFVYGGVLGESIKIKNYQIFELPEGSQIEADFNNLTADQLAAKYTFNGLCVKNWKHIVGNQADIDASKTAVLPTASYAGYTPYKMLYQLATPVEEQYTPAPVPTHLGQTIISTDSVVKPNITTTVKIPD